MKLFLSLTLLAAVAFAEPPAYRQRYFVARQQEEPSAASAPYPARGWKPEGPAFNLPQRQEQAPQVDNAYGAPQKPEPQQQYGPPKQQYGPPAQQPLSPRQQALPAFKPSQFARQQQQQPQQQYGTPQESQQQKGVLARFTVPNPREQYGAPPQQPQQQYGAPQQPQQQYGAPQQQQQQPQQQYGAPQQQQQQPQQQYGAPQQQPQQYGAPDYTTTEIPDAAEIDEPTTVGGLPDNEAEAVSSVNELEEDADLEAAPRPEPQQRGEYYVALPDGRLQRVRYVSRQDLEAMRYFAKIRAENIEPLRGPIYAYSPLQKLEVVPGNLQVGVAPATVAVAPVAPSGLTVTATEAKPQKIQQQPKIDIKPLTQVQVQHDNVANAVPLSSSYTTYSASYQVPEDRYILAFP